MFNPPTDIVDHLKPFKISPVRSHETISPYCLFPGCIVTWAWSLAKGQYMASWLHDFWTFICLKRFTSPELMYVTSHLFYAGVHIAHLHPWRVLLSHYGSVTRTPNYLLDTIQKPLKPFSHDQKNPDSLRRILRAGIVYLNIPPLTAFASFHTTQCNNSTNVPRDECTDIAGYHWTIEFSVLIIASTSEMITFHLRAVRACVCDIRPRTIT